MNPATTVVGVLSGDSENGYWENKRLCGIKMEDGELGVVRFL